MQAEHLHTCLCTAVILQRYLLTWLGCYDSTFCRILATQLQSLISSSDCPARHKSPTDPEFSTLLHTQHLPLYTSVLRLCHNMKGFKDRLTEIGLSYQDIEWWSRAIMLRTVMQVCHLCCTGTPKHLYWLLYWLLIWVCCRQADVVVCWMLASAQCLHR